MKETQRGRESQVVREREGGEAVRTCEIESEEGVKYLLNSAPPKCVYKVLYLTVLVDICMSAEY